MSHITFRYQLLGIRRAANFNTTADQAIAIDLPALLSRYVIDKIDVLNASTSLTLAAGGFYTAGSKGGSAIVAAVQVYSGLTGSTLLLNPTLALATTLRTETTLFFSLTTAQGGAATADIYVWGRVFV